MPTWITVTASVVTILSLIGGALNFPYVPMWFGLYGAEKHSPRGKLVYKFIWGFPIVAIVSLILGWTSNGIYTLIPIAYAIIIWFIRPNKHDSQGPDTQYRDAHKNLEARLADIEYRWQQWESQGATRQYLLLTLLAKSHDAANAINSSISHSEKLHSAVETSLYDNDTATVYVRVTLDTVDKDTIITILKRIVDIAWKTECEVSSIDVMEEE